MYFNGNNYLYMLTKLKNLIFFFNENEILNDD